MTAPPKAVSYIMSAIFLGLGGFMLVWRAQPNCWIGVRLPWTMADRKIWDKSWRLASVFLVGMGIWALVSWKVFLVPMVHFIVLAILYPILLYRLKYGTLRYWKDAGWLSYRPVARCRHCGHFQRISGEGELEKGLCEACGGLLKK